MDPIYVIKTKTIHIFYIKFSFNLITMCSTCFELPSVHPQEELYMQFYGISFLYPYKQSCLWQVVFNRLNTELNPICQ